MGVKMPSLGTPTLRAPGAPEAPPQGAPLPAYAPSMSRDPNALPGFAPSMSTGELRDPTKGMEMPKGMTMSPSGVPTFATPAASGERWYARKVPGLNLPVWQVALGGVGVLAIGAGLVSLLAGRKPASRRFGYR